MIRLPTRQRPVDEENPYWISFSDIMAALLLVFILASVVLMLQLIERQQDLQQLRDRFEAEFTELRQAEAVRQQLLSEIRDELEARGIRVEVTENHSVVRISDDLLGFRTGAHEIDPEYRDAARQIGEVISDVITRHDRNRYLDTIFIEGHTDNRPYHNPQMKGNWGLSTFRAISLWELWRETLDPVQRLDRLTNPEGRALFSVSGYAETRPVTPMQLTDEELRVNRRIDIRFTVRRPSSVDYRELERRFETD